MGVDVWTWNLRYAAGEWTRRICVGGVVASGYVA